MASFMIKGVAFESSLSNAQAAAVIIGMGDKASSFGKDLVKQLMSKKSLSSAQLAWLHKLAMDAKSPAPAAAAVVDLSGVAAMFETAASNLKYPKIHLDHGELHLCLSLAGSKAKVPGSINVTDGRKYPDNSWFGRIVGGKFEPARNCPQEVVEFLQGLNENPAGMARDYGRKTGHCCFCGLLLTDNKDGGSVERGYGPICASNWGLPHGSTGSRPAQMENGMDEVLAEAAFHINENAAAASAA